MKVSDPPLAVVAFLLWPLVCAVLLLAVGPGWRKLERARLFYGGAAAMLVLAAWCAAALLVVWWGRGWLA